ncbi:MAG TPA: NAD(P)-dependent oxidoreductase [Anaerolineaceae bacterium]|uniref:Putative oxidoreductase n=1 Tax=Anaerolinea thermophila TaxID=167964 RepID=A0A101FXP2_9CHLR|nr:MAG: Putative oxidoreductase [Anaerolinea thermophila]HAF62283.1 NAD(P)-dependent oxidoreductase [Anaerolineaceae bacterium]
MSEPKIVLITGAAGGIGSATVRRFSQAGWKVIGVDRREFEEDFPSDGLFILADISKPQDISAIYDQASAFSPYLNAVVNNAAVQISKPIVETSIEEWDMVMASNLRSAFLGAKFAHPLLVKAGGGAIVNVSSVHAVATSVNVAAYAASKGGMLALTRAMAIEFAPDNIRVNAVLPGAVDTAMLRDGMNRGQHGGASMQERLENLARKTVNGRIGQPQEIANTIFFLAGEQSSFMTGQALIVDGGATARLSTE